MTCPMTLHLGVYALGAADAGERRLVEAHLEGCPLCRGELMRLAPLPGLLARVPMSMLTSSRPAAAPAGKPAAARFRGRLTRSWRACLTRSRLAAVVAAVTAAAAGAVGGFWLAPGGSGAPPPAKTLSGANPAMHIRATAALTGTSWGTSIVLRLRGAPLNEQCWLVVHSRSGGTEVTGFWDAWSTGPVSVPASAAWWPSDITSLQVATEARGLVTLTAVRPSPGRPASSPGPEQAGLYSGTGSSGIDGSEIVAGSGR